jgi:hypothetical protein
MFLLWIPTVDCLSGTATRGLIIDYKQGALIQVDMKSVLYVPSRWVLYCCTMPAIWWILAHISTYSTRRKLYVLWLNWVMLIAGGLATIPWISWGHKGTHMTRAGNCGLCSFSTVDDIYR